MCAVRGHQELTWRQRGSNSCELRRNGLKICLCNFMTAVEQSWFPCITLSSFQSREHTLSRRTMCALSQASCGRLTCSRTAMYRRPRTLLRRFYKDDDRQLSDSDSHEWVTKGSSCPSNFCTLNYKPNTIHLSHVNLKSQCPVTYASKPQPLNPNACNICTGVAYRFHESQEYLHLVLMATAAPYSCRR